MKDALVVALLIHRRNDTKDVTLLKKKSRPLIKLNWIRLSFALKFIGRLEFRNHLKRRNLMVLSFLLQLAWDKRVLLIARTITLLIPLGVNRRR